MLIGEASHGTHEFYRERAFITERLISEDGFPAVAVEADWPDAYRVNRYVRGAARRRSAVQALGDFSRFPTWMWRNADVLDVRRLAARAQRHAASRAARRASMASTCTACAPRCRRCSPTCRGSILKPRRSRGRDTPASTTSVTSRSLTATPRRPGWAPSCEQRGRHAARRSATSVERTMQPRRPARARRVLLRGTERAPGPERRAVLPGHVSRTHRIVEPARPAHGGHDRGVAALPGRNRGRPRRSSIWAHNSHLGEPGRPRWANAGELNVGQLVRERHGADSVLGRLHHLQRHGDGRVGLGCARRTETRPAGPADSYERLFHETGTPAFPAAAARRQGAGGQH